MNAIDRINEAFKSGELLSPTAAEPNFVGLSRVLAFLNGAAPIARTPGNEGIAAAVGEGEHYVFVLVDGLGARTVEALPAGSFLRSHLKLVLRSVFPSATTAPLTTLATGRWPGQHGAIGWFTYLPDHQVTIVPLPYADRATGVFIDSADIHPAHVFGAPALIPSHRSQTRSVVPRQQIDSVSSHYFRGNTKALGYTSLDEAVDIVIEQFSRARGRSYTYVYYPGVDSVGHALGPLDGAYALEVARVDEALRRLRESLPSSAVLIVSADHGCIPITSADRESLADARDLLATLLVPPTGEGRTTIYHVRSGLELDFRAAFKKSFSDRFWLLTRDEAIALKLVGPKRPAATAYARMGGFIALGIGNREMLLEGIPPLRGDHGGLTADEMLIPLIVA